MSPDPSALPSSYWEAFSLYWSLRILIELLALCSDLLGGNEVAPEKHDEIMNWITAFKPIPIITTAELKFWGQSAD